MAKPATPNAPESALRWLFALIGCALAAWSPPLHAADSASAAVVSADIAPAKPALDRAVVAAWFRLVGGYRPNLAAVAAQLEAHPELAQAWSPPDPSRPWQKPYTALHRAAASENRALCQLLIDHHASLDAQTQETAAPLFWCSPAMGRWLIGQGAHPSIFWYASVGDATHVASLLAQRPELATATLRGSTALAFAAGATPARDPAGNPLLVTEALVAAGADVNAVDGDGRSMLLVAVGLDDQASRDPVAREVVDALLAHGARWDAFAAAVHGRLAELAAELDRHPELLAKRLSVAAGRGGQLIHLACAGDHQACVAALLARGAHLTDADLTGATPLHYACQHGSALVGWLLAQGADPNARDRRGRTPRDWAASFRNVLAMKALGAAVATQERARAAERASNDF